MRPSCWQSTAWILPRYVANGQRSCRLRQCPPGAIGGNRLPHIPHTRGCSLKFLFLPRSRIRSGWPASGSIFFPCRTNSPPSTLLLGLLMADQEVALWLHQRGLRPDAIEAEIRSLYGYSLQKTSESQREVLTYEHFTDRARKVMQLANQEAQRLNHECIGTEHILLGLLKEGSGVAATLSKIWRQSPQPPVQCGGPRPMRDRHGHDGQAPQDASGRACPRIRRGGVPKPWSILCKHGTYSPRIAPRAGGRCAPKC